MSQCKPFKHKKMDPSVHWILIQGYTPSMGSGSRVRFSKHGKVMSKESRNIEQKYSNIQQSLKNIKCFLDHHACSQFVNKNIHMCN